MVVEGFKRPYVIPVDDPPKVCALLSGNGHPVESGVRRSAETSESSSEHLTPPSQTGGG